MNSRSDMPPIWRIRKIGSHWTILRLQPVRHTLYFPVAKTKTHADALLWLCHRAGICGHDDPQPDLIEEGRKNF